MTDAIASRSRSVQAHTPQGEFLRIVPILGASHDQPPYTLLDTDALRSVEITEISAAGSVPELKVVNRLDSRLFLMDGQELVGAKQNRILNTDILVPASQSMVIPVSCVEQGRWHPTSSAFTRGKSASHRVRASKLQQVHASLRQRQQHDADQHEVWEEVAASLHASRVGSPTQALSDAYTQRQRELATVRSQLHVPEDAVGLAVFHDGQLQGLDLFDRHATLRYYWESLVDSYAIDFMLAPGQHRPGSTDAVQAVDAVLARVAVGNWEVFDSPGEGRDCRLVDTGLAGSALVWEETTVIHMQLFPRRNAADRLGRPHLRPRYLRE